MIPKGRLWVRSRSLNERHDHGSLHVYWAKWNAQNNGQVLGTVGTILVVTIMHSPVCVAGYIKFKLNRARISHNGVWPGVKCLWLMMRSETVPPWLTISVYALNIKVWRSKWVLGWTMNEWINKCMNEWMKILTTNKPELVKMFP